MGLMSVADREFVGQGDDRFRRLVEVGSSLLSELDLAVDASLAAGAIGARMTGGGFGGAAIALVRIDDAAAVETSVRAAFADAGFTEPAIFPIVPSEGPRRDV